MKAIWLPGRGKDSSVAVEGGGSAVSALSPAEILDALIPDLIITLGNLHKAPPAVAEAAVQLLPFGSRASLVATELATWDGADPSAGSQHLRLTPLAFDVMAAAAARAAANPTAINSWARRAALAREAVSERTAARLADSSARSR